MERDFNIDLDIKKVEFVDPITGEVRAVSPEDVAHKVYHRLDLKPDPYEKLDPVPLEVPLDAEVPLTKNQLLQKFGWNFAPSLEDDGDDNEDWDNLDEDFDLPPSDHEIQSDGFTKIEQEVETARAFHKKTAKALKLLEEQEAKKEAQPEPADGQEDPQ